MAATTFILLSFCVAITLAALECQDPKISAMKVSLTTRENETGHWETQVAFQQEATGGGQGHIWVAGVDQNIVQCGQKMPLIETVLHLQASPSSSPKSSHSSTWLTPICPTVAVAPPPKTPPPYYELFPGVGYYKFHNGKVAWPQARKVCAAEGGHLMILNSEEENGVAKQIFARHPHAGTWFHAGWSEMGVNLEYYTIFGETLESTGYSSILPGENNDRGVNDFGVMNRNGGYADAPPGYILAFICEFDL